MLDPKPGRTGRKPSRILSKTRLEHAWRSSRDATSNPGAAGVDPERADGFKFNLNFNLRKVADHLAKGEYGFQKLKAFFIPKANSAKLRVIWIPTVRDRLVRRAIINYLYSNSRIPVRHPFLSDLSKHPDHATPLMPQSIFAADLSGALRPTLKRSSIEFLVIT